MPRPFRRKTDQEWADGPDGAWVDADGNSRREPPVATDWRVRAEVTVLVIFAAILPALFGAVSVVFGDFSTGIFWLLGSSAVAGLAAGARIPLRDRAFSDPELGVSPSYRPLIVAATVYACSVLVGLYLVAVVGALTLPHFDAGIWGLAPLYWLLIVLGGGVGLLVGILTISPIWDLAMERQNVRDGRGVPAASVGLAVTLLLIVASAVPLILGLRIIEPALVSRGIGLAIGLEAFFGIQFDPAHPDFVVVSQPAMWVFRVVVIAFVVSATLTIHAGKRRWGVRSAARPADPKPGP